MLSRRGILTMAALAGPLAPTLARAQSTQNTSLRSRRRADEAAVDANPNGPPYPFEFTKYPEIPGAAISPDGKILAIVRTKSVKLTEDRTDYTSTVTFRDAETFADINGVVLNDTVINRIRWKDNDRVIMDLAPTDLSEFGTNISRNRPRGIVVMHKTTHRAVRMPEGVVVDWMDTDPNHIMLRNIQQGLWTLMLVDTNTGAQANVEQGTTFTTGWYIQNGKPIVRIDQDGFRQDVRIYYGRDPSSKNWREIGRFRYDGVNGNDFDILGTSRDKPGVVWVATNAAGENYRPLREFNLIDSSWGATLSRQNGDAVGCLVDMTGAYLGAIYIDDAPLFDCADADMTTHMAELARAFPNSALTIDNISNDHNRVVCRLNGANDAGSFIFYDRQQGKVRPLGDMRPWLKAERLPTSAMLTVRAKNGPAIRAYLTIPKGGGKRPMVVFPHGGPEGRDQLGLDLFAQGLAAKGWYVLQPNFRGSAGYGKAFTEAGYRQWNGVIQEDVEAAIQEALARYPIDRDKVAIAGASFGGYVSLMSAIRNPAAYKAVVGLSGVYDLLQSLRRSRTGEGGEQSVGYQYWKKAIGDPDKDEAMIRQASPSLRAKEIKAPVLLIHGTVDPVVHPEQSQIMARALRSASATLVFEEIPGMQHGPSGDAQYSQVINMMTDFLGKYLN